MYGNRLRRLPEGVQQLRRLTLLYAGQNELSSVPPLGQLAALTELDLSNNLLRSVPTSIGACSQLRVLYLQHNRLDHLPSQLGRLQQLSLLDVRHNQLPVLPAELTRLPQLLTIYFGDNPLHWVDSMSPRVTS